MTCRGTKIDTGKRYPFVTVTAPGETKHHHFHHRASKALLHTTRDDLIIPVPPTNRYCRSPKSRRQKKVLDTPVVSTTGATSSAPLQRIRQQRVKDTLLSLAGFLLLGVSCESKVAGSTMRSVGKKKDLLSRSPKRGNAIE